MSQIFFLNRNFFCFVLLMQLVGVEKKAQKLRKKNQQATELLKRTTTTTKFKQTVVTEFKLITATSLQTRFD